MKNKVRVFNNIEEACCEYGLSFKIPSYIPNDCNIISYDSENSEDITFYMECKNGLYFYSVLEKDWKPTYNSSLDGEIYDDIENGYDYIYLRLESHKEKFTPERLLGVETNYGYIIGFSDIFSNLLLIKCFNGLCVHLSYESLRFYISDDSDETVSFDEYVDMFYTR